MKVRVNKPLLMDGRTIPAGTIIDLSTEAAQLLGDRVEPAGRGKAQTAGRGRKQASTADPEDADDDVTDDDSEDADTDEASDEENENPKE